MFKRGELSVPGLFLFLALGAFFFAFAPVAANVISTSLGQTHPDLFTTVAEILLLPTIFVALIAGYWNSISG